MFEWEGCWEGKGKDFDKKVKKHKEYRNDILSRLKSAGTLRPLVWPPTDLVPIGAQAIESVCVAAGFILTKHLSRDVDECFVKISAPQVTTR